ncbi:MAG: exodeoxyribonuclease III [Tissierellia bacterium]|nr:exodeoxyribonuclease III [Tissierellia bacterium]
MKLISWNVNGFRAALRKGFVESLRDMDPDIICLQEIKMQEGQASLDLPDYEEYYNYAERPGYSGTAVFTKVKPISVKYGIGMEEHDTEGRVITMEFEYFYLVNVYTPNSKTKLERLEYRMLWEDLFKEYLHELDSEKPVILCGDLNVAHEEIDLKNPSTNRRSAGFTDEERNKLTLLLDSGFTDSYRHFYPDKTDAYTWWSYFAKSRERNVGWRIDYFLVSDRFTDNLKDAMIYPEIMGSDHCPVGILF